MSDLVVQVGRVQAIPIIVSPAEAHLSKEIHTLDRYHTSIRILEATAYAFLVV